MSRLALLMVGGLTLLTGCTAWYGTTMPLPEVIADHGDRIRVTQRDVGQIEVRRPVVVKDTLRGLRSNGAPVAIPVAEILRVETRGQDPGRTTWLVAGFLAVAATVYITVLIVAMTSW